MTPPAKLFHFGKLQHLERFVPDGQLSFGIASRYTKAELTEAQRDDEHNRIFTPDVQRIQLFAGSPGDAAQPISNLTHLSITLGIQTTYYIMCFAHALDPALYEAFHADVCIEIREPETFLTRLDTALITQHPDWGALAGPVQYDKCELPLTNNQAKLCFLKHVRYADQQEFRIALFGQTQTPAPERVPLVLGSLADICQVHPK